MKTGIWIALTFCLLIDNTTISTGKPSFEPGPEKIGRENKVCGKKSGPQKLRGNGLKKLAAFNKSFQRDTHMPVYEGYLVHLKGFGRVTFYTNNHQFLLIKNNKVIYRSPAGYVWTISEFKAVSFYDLNKDGFEDITLISTQMTGMGSRGAHDFPVCYIFLSNKKKSFYLLKNEKGKPDDETSYFFDFKDFGEVLRYARQRF
ncbi:MAG: hypothetical protein OEZ36_04545 [Spirochaetota bacterium]|nr:hypothetical protein [Spirochaetota bacterium]